MLTSSPMWPLKLLCVVALVQLTCLAQEKERGPRMDFSIQGGNPLSGVNEVLGSNIAKLFNPMSAVNAAFTTLNGILKPGSSSATSTAGFQLPFLPGFSGTSDRGAFSLRANGGNAPLPNSGSNSASFAIHNLAGSQPGSGAPSSDGASFSFNTHGGARPAANSGSIGLDIGASGLSAASNGGTRSTGENSISNSDLRLDLGATGTGGAESSRADINAGSSSSSSEFNGSAGGRSGLRARSLRMSAKPPKARGRSLLKSRDSSQTHINLSASNNQLSRSSRRSNGSSRDGSSTQAMVQALASAKPQDSVNFSAGSLSRPSTSLRGSLDSPSSRRSFTVVDDHFSSSHSAPREHRISFHTGRGQPEADIIEISQFNFKPPATARRTRVGELSIPEFNGYYEGAYCNTKSPFLMLKSEHIGDKTKIFVKGALGQRIDVLLLKEGARIKCNYPLLPTANTSGL